MHWAISLAFSLGAFTPDFSFEPQAPFQGQVLKVIGNAPAQAVRLKTRTLRLFPQDDGRQLALMPIGVLAKPGVYTLEWLDADGDVIHSAHIFIRNAHYAKQNIFLTKALARLRATPDEKETVAAFLKEVSAQRFWKEPFEAPVPGCVVSPFGVKRLHNRKPTGDFHAGLDQRAALGSSVHAVTAGVVRIARQFTLRGGTVAIDHGQGLESIYLHLSQIATKEGDQVKPGDIIGYAGSTGRSTGAHLHWALYANGEPVSPLQWVHLKRCPEMMARPHVRRHRKSR